MTPSASYQIGGFMVLRSTLSRVSLAVIAAVIAVVLISAFNIGLPSYGYSYAQNGSPVASPSAVPNSPTATSTVEPSVTATIPEETNTPVVCEDQYFKNGECETPVPTATATPDPDEAEPTITVEEPIFVLPSTGVGSTALLIHQSNHTGYQTVYFCEAGIKFALYQYVVHRGSGINSYHDVKTLSINRVGYCSWW